MMLTYNNSPEFKTAFLAELGKHEAADALIKGTYGQMNSHFRGCAIGCSLNSLNVLQGKEALYETGNHRRMPAELGWPLWLAYAEDNIFERLPDDLSNTWPRRLATAIPVGVTVPDVVLAKFLRWMLIDTRFGVVHADDTKSTKNIVRTMGALFDRTIAGEVVPEAEWDAVARAARAAWDARVARAASAAWAARDAWAASDARAAWAARDARAAWAARDARAAWDGFYPALSDELLRLLRELDPLYMTLAATSS